MKLVLLLFMRQPVMDLKLDPCGRNKLSVLAGWNCRRARSRSLTILGFGVINSASDGLLVNSRGTFRPNRRREQPINGCDKSLW
jgi:hypothetical protein